MDFENTLPENKQVKDQTFTSKINSLWPSDAIFMKNISIH